MEGSFVRDGANSTIMLSGFPHISEDTNSRATDLAGKGASDMAANATSQELVDGDAARLVGMVPEWPDPEGLSDDQLMAAVADGNCAALEKLYDRHVQRCFGIAVWLVQDPSLAEDIVQEAFIKLWSRPQIFSPGRGTFQAWLLVIVRNRAVDELRKAKRRSDLHMMPLHAERAGSEAPIDVLPDTAPTPHDQVWTKETARVIRLALDQLPAAEYQTITLAYFGGLTQREIADTLQEPLGTVKTRTRSALHRLHRLLAAHNALSD